MKRYELAIILHPDLEIDLEAALLRVEKLLLGRGATIKHKENRGKDKLAYPINKQSHGIYVFYTVEIEPAAVKELDASLRLADEILRYLLVVPPSESMQAATDKTTPANNKRTPAPKASVAIGESK